MQISLSITPLDNHVGQLLTFAMVPVLIKDSYVQIIYIICINTKTRIIQNFDPPQLQHKSLLVVSIIPSPEACIT